MNNTLQEWLSGERGRAKALAVHLRIPPPMVSKMARGAKQVPLDHCPAIELFTSGAVLCESLRPDKVAFFNTLRRRIHLDGEAVADKPQQAQEAANG